jgi:hypothetical protein
MKKNNKISMFIQQYRMVPYLVPISHMAVMISNFATGIMGFER